MTGAPGAAAGAPDPGAAAWLHLDFTGEPAAPRGAVVLRDPARADPATVTDAVADVIGTGDDIHDAVRMLGGLAGLERIIVWWRARALADESGGPVVVPCAGGGTDAELDRLRLLAVPGELAGLIDAFAPRLDRHRQMPAVFGDRSGRAHALERMWARCADFDRSVFGGGAAVHVPAAGGGAAVAEAAGFLGLPVIRGGRPDVPERPRLRADGPGDDGTLRFTWRIPLPGGLAGEGDCGAVVRGRELLAWAGPWRRRMTLPAVLGACAHVGTRVAVRDGRPGDGGRPDSGGVPGGDILVAFRSVAGLLPGGQ